MTKIIKVNRNNLDESLLLEAANALSNNKLVAFPTETVYGLGANAMDINAVKNIYIAKGRPSDNPLIIHIGDIKQLTELTNNVPQKATKLISKFWPGPLTLIFKKNKSVPAQTTGNLDTVAIRLPNHPIALSLLRLSKVPIAAPSANLSGKPSPTIANHVISDLDNRVDYIIDGGDVEIGVESTILDMTAEPPTLLRPGSITIDDIENVIGKIDIYTKKDNGEKELAKAPGMKYRHYSPIAKIILITKNFNNKVINKIIDENPNKKIGILNHSKIVSNKTNIIFKSILDDKEYAKNLFKFLREFDKQNIDIIIAEAIEEKNVGLAVMNRLKKAASIIL